MKLLHVSDTHVGFANYARLTPDGLNQREQDFFDAFQRSVDLAIERRVDVVLHSGDLFDSVRPTNRAIHHVLAQAKRLSEAKIPFVVISGNHEAPRLRETGAVLRLLEFMPNVHAVYRGVYEKIRIGDLAIHAVPHAADNDALRAELGLVHQDETARFNVATLHAGVMGVGDFRTGEFHEQVIGQGDLPRGMDYVALGHYHRAVEVAPGAWYAGSTERCTFKEASEEKSVNLIDLERGAVSQLPLPARPMIDLQTLRCEGMDEGDIAPELYRRLDAAELNGSIGRLKVTALPAHVYAMLDFRRIKDATSGALHFELQPEIVRLERAGLASESISDLPAEFEAFLSQRSLTGGDRDAILATARELLVDAAKPEVAS